MLSQNSLPALLTIERSSAAGALRVLRRVGLSSTDQVDWMGTILLVRRSQLITDSQLPR